MRVARRSTLLSATELARAAAQLPLVPAAGAGFLPVASDAYMKKDCAGGERRPFEEPIQDQWDCGRRGGGVTQPAARRLGGSDRDLRERRLQSVVQRGAQRPDNLQSPRRNAVRRFHPGADAEQVRRRLAL